ncbi:F0F1 ATP synthase subunit A [Eggerthia catenaformis]|uniref:F0F1 ATP synthase subunit A n=1 Tax=Eggerthia catenaformis TaxID=31973 RepID=UPI00248DE14F|nr:F0F1 ATP synthase subunit A [Eggerthia catenaformis]
MSTFFNNLQPELISSITVMIILSIIFIKVGKKAEAADPLERPKGALLVAEVGIKTIYAYLKGLMPKKFEKNYYPYFAMLFAYLIVSNLWGLTGFEAPTTNYSITLSLGLITFVLIQWNSIKAHGIGSYIKDALLPPTNLLGKVSPLISLSMRIFCNLLSGSFIMGLVYGATKWVSYHLIPFNFLGPVIAPILHIYFDVFSGVIQALVFMTLSSILISIENPDEE